MKVIMDIDQDFFFLPEVYGDNDTDTLEQKQWRAENQKQVIFVQELIEKYNLKGKQYTIFRDHNQAFWYIRNTYGKIDKLLHFDAHYDFFENEKDFKKGVGIGDWISHLIHKNVCNDIDWITPKTDWVKTDDRYLTTHNSIFDYIPYKETFFDFENHEFQGDVTDVLFTVSPGFCPHSKLVYEFIEGMRD